MRRRKNIPWPDIIVTACLLATALRPLAQGQHLQNKTISLTLHHLPLSKILDTIGRQVHLEFSYNSTIVHGDSLVSVTFREVNVLQTLDQLLGKGYTYSERGKYLIILQSPEGQIAQENTYLLTGYIRDKNTGQGIFNASVYEKEQLQSVLTDEQGTFKLRLKVRYPPPVLRISKEWYRDTAFVIHPGYDQTLTIGITPVKVTELTPVLVASSKIERSHWGRFFLTSKQRIQSINLSHFFTTRPAQVSLLPWVGTHGKMSSQVSNDISLNVIGGYTAGLQGVELAGAFNIDKRDVNGVQIAGAINLVGGNVHGVQVAGLLNHVSDSFAGVQLSGVANKVKGNVRGVQAACYINICKDTLRGVQISGFQNKTGLLKGVQLGIINVADSSTGFSIGLISIVKHGGVHRLALSETEVTGLTAEYIGGNKNLNSIVVVSYNPWRDDKLFSYGYGLGRDIPFTKRWGLYTQATAQQIYDTRGSWKSLGLIARLQTELTFQLNKKTRFFAGPAFSVFVAQSSLPSTVHPLDIASKSFPAVAWSGRTAGWLGAYAGISFF